MHALVQQFVDKWVLFWRGYCLKHYKPVSYTYKSSWGATFTSDSRMCPDCREEKSLRRARRGLWKDIDSEERIARLKK